MSGDDEDYEYFTDIAEAFEASVRPDSTSRYE